MATSADRVATRYSVALRFAMEHSSPEAMKDYLHDHPHADPKNHTVKGPEDKGHGDGEHGDDHGEHHDDKFLGGIRGLAEKLKDAPAGVKKFFSDPEHRNKSLKDSAKDIQKSPKSYVKRLVDTIKHEGAEFKDAFEGVKSAMKGGKPTPKQKKAIKTIATHLAITGAAVALSASTPALAATATGKALGRYIAMKAVSKVMADLHILDELGHIGHGLSHLMHLAAEEEKKVTPEEALSGLVLKKVTELLEGGISDKDLEDALSEDEGDSKTAARVAIRASATSAVLTDILGELLKLKVWTKTFPGALRASRAVSKDAPPGHLWMGEWADFWSPFDPIQRKLYRLSEVLRREDPELAETVDDLIDPPKAARIEEAISSPKFAERNGEEEIAYPEKDLLNWHRAFSGWVDTSVAEVRDLLK